MQSIVPLRKVHGRFCIRLSDKDGRWENFAIRPWAAQGRDDENAAREISKVKGEGLRGYRCARVLLGILLLSACHARSDPDATDAGDSQPWSEIGPNQIVHVQGDEGGEGDGTAWRATIEGPDLHLVPPSGLAGGAPLTMQVTRFAGRGGLSFSADLDAAPVTLAISMGPCRLGKQERSYPYSATLALGARLLSGCAWTGEQAGSAQTGRAARAQGSARDDRTGTP